MTVTEVLAALKSLGTEQNRKTYLRHGAGANTFGVSFANLEKLRKQIRRDHALAAGLWNTGNFDAGNLATMIADPALMSGGDLDAWAKKLGNRCLADLFARNIASKSAFALEKIETWTSSTDEMLGAAGFTTLASIAASGSGPDDACFEAWLAKIEARIHAAPNLTRNAMNGAVIAIGLRNPRLKQAALAAAARIGKVVVDHGQTACKTPDAIAYINKAAQRQAAKTAPKTTRTKTTRTKAAAL